MLFFTVFMRGSLSLLLLVLLLVAMMVEIERCLESVGDVGIRNLGMMELTLIGIQNDRWL